MQKSLAGISSFKLFVLIIDQANHNENVPAEDDFMQMKYIQGKEVSSKYDGYYPIRGNLPLKMY